MLHRLHLVQVGPAPSLTAEFLPRLNVLVGNNGVGKSFILDVAWWALTRSWARQLVMPQPGAEKPTISFLFDTATKKKTKATATFSYENEWELLREEKDPPNSSPEERKAITARIREEGRNAFANANPNGIKLNTDRRARGYGTGVELPSQSGGGRPPIPGMVLYAQLDGGFSAWDPARNYWQAKERASSGRPSSYLFRPEEIWDGLPLNEPRKHCNGLIDDWERWQRENGDTFRIFKDVLLCLSPSQSEALRPGELTTVGFDARYQPTIKMPYGDIPLLHASAGVRRVVALAYLLVWVWREHKRFSEMQGKPPAKEIIFLIDEVETHLHPQWQRRIVPSLLQVMKALGEEKVPVQLILATHSPLVVASLEPHFDSKKDRLLEMDLVKDQVQIRPFEWVPRGDANSWLRSALFDETEPVSVEAEKAKKQALELLQTRPQTRTAAVEEVHKALQKTLSELDPFWLRWARFFDELPIPKGKRSNQG